MKNWRRIVQGILAVMIITGMIWIYPAGGIGIIPYESISGTGEFIGTGNLTGGAAVSQSFRAEHKYLQRISIYMQNLEEDRSGNLLFSLYDSENNLVFNSSEELKDIPNYEWWDIKIGARLAKGGEYYYTIQTDKADSENELQIFKTSVENGPDEHISYSYNGKEENASLAVGYKYREPVTGVFEAVPYWMMLMLPGTLLIEALQIRRKAD